MLVLLHVIVIPFYVLCWDFRVQKGEREVEQNSDDKADKSWRNAVHPSRQTDVTSVTEMGSREGNRTDQFVSERFRKTSGFVRPSAGAQLDEKEGRRRGEREGRRTEGWRERESGVVDERRGWRAERGERLVGGRGEGVHVEGEMDVDEERGRGGKNLDGRGRGGRVERGRGGGRVDRRRGDVEVEREEEEREEREYQEKRLLDSLTDPRDVPKGTWYFEVSKTTTHHPSLDLLHALYVYKQN